MVRSGCGSISIAHLVEVAYVLLADFVPLGRVLADGNTTDALLLFVTEVCNEKASIVSCLVLNRVLGLVGWFFVLEAMSLLM